MRGEETALGSLIVLVPASHWQAARPLGDFSLVGYDVAPGFEIEDFCFVADSPGISSFSTHILSA